MPAEAASVSSYYSRIVVHILYRLMVRRTAKRTKMFQLYVLLLLLLRSLT